MRSSLIVLALAIGVSVQLAQAEDQQTSTAGPSSSNTYFGVDANNHHAVRQVVDELNKDKFEQLFGKDVKIEDMDFTPMTEQGKSIEKLGVFLANMLDIFRTGTTSTAAPPTGSQ